MYPVHSLAGIVSLSCHFWHEWHEFMGIGGSNRLIHANPFMPFHGWISCHALALSYNSCHSWVLRRPKAPFMPLDSWVLKKSSGNYGSNQGCDIRHGLVGPTTRATFETCRDSYVTLAWLLTKTAKLRVTNISGFIFWSPKQSKTHFQFYFDSAL